jgi:hypothetical protein
MTLGICPIKKKKPKNKIDLPTHLEIMSQSTSNKNIFNDGLILASFIVYIAALVSV